MTQNNDDKPELRQISDEELKKVLEEHKKWADSGFEEIRGGEQADLSRTNLFKRNLQEVDLRFAHLEGAFLYEAHLEGADLGEAHLEGADLMAANFENVEVRQVTYNRKTCCRGIRVATCYGSPMFKRFAQDQDFIEELQAKGKKGKFLYYLWLIFADCGRTPWRWIAWASGFALLFGVFYSLLGAGAFDAKPQGLPWILNAFYYSVVTFTTLGFGDITPMTAPAVICVMIKVALGYVMLGGLISIFFTLIARRS
ncbi:MAG: pentapeptide repeat-containing protein [Deltaproteobacteria bacterium]|nr:pentapeptide repeat-containing protein [Deltaproteobacteria bacterium]